MPHFAQKHLSWYSFILSTNSSWLEAIESNFCGLIIFQQEDSICMVKVTSPKGDNLSPLHDRGDSSTFDNVNVASDSSLNTFTTDPSTSTSKSWLLPFFSLQKNYNIITVQCWLFILCTKPVKSQSRFLTLYMVLNVYNLFS